MKISIIIPVYNVEDYILECLSSIVGLNVNYEIIVVNDGSQDNSISKINDFVKTYDGTIKVINKDNGGLSSARNVGVENSTGDYLFFLDSDDYIEKSMFESFANNVLNEGVDLGFADYKYLKNGVAEANKETEYRRKIALKSNDIVDGVTYGSRFFDKIHNFINVEACFLLVKKKLLVENSIKFMEGIYHEDTLFTLSCLMVAKKVRYYDYPFYIYRMRENSIMHSPDPKIEEKKYKDKGIIALELFKLKNKNNISAEFLDTQIVDLLLVSRKFFRKRIDEDLHIVSQCNKLTLKSRLRLFIFKFLSLSYA